MSDVETILNSIAQHVATSRAIRSVLVVPMLREGIPIGAIAVNRSEPRPFSDREIALVARSPTRRSSRSRTCACSQSSGRRTAISPSRSSSRRPPARSCALSPAPRPTSSRCLTPSLRNALKLCDAHVNAVTLYDGELLHLVALANGTQPEGAEALREAYPRRAEWGAGGGRAVSTRAVVQIPDVLTDRAYELKSEQRPRATEAFWRSRCYGTASPSERSASGGASLGRSPTNRSRWSRPSPTRRSSRSRTCACSGSCGHGRPS